MIDRLVRGSFPGYRLVLVRMSFSDDLAQIGTFSLRKVVRLIGLVVRMIYSRIRYGATVLYYPPAPPDKMPMYRDFVALGLTRWMFRKTIFHFHAGGISQLEKELPPFQRWLFRRAYLRPDVAIRVSSSTPEDGKALHALEEAVVPNGIEDAYVSDGARRDENPVPVILFLGFLAESKGILELLDACSRLKAAGRPFRLELGGEFRSPTIRRKILALIEAGGIAEDVELLGVVTGRPKTEALLRANVFCYPSHSETFGLAVVEAMQFELPVVASAWPGVTDLVVDGDNGYVVPINSSEELVKSLTRLIEDSDVRVRMGRAGRKKYLEEFTIDRFRSGMLAVFDMLDESGRPSHALR